jgi:hypothetical protein
MEEKTRKCLGRGLIYSGLAALAVSGASLVYNVCNAESYKNFPSSAIERSTQKESWSKYDQRTLYSGLASFASLGVASLGLKLRDGKFL